MSTPKTIAALLNDSATDYRNSRVQPMKKQSIETVTARQVVALLAARHTRDCFFAEVKDGPTWGAAPMRIDALERHAVDVWPKK